MSRPPIRAAGGVVFSEDPSGTLRLLLIQDRYGVWTLPKGHLEGDETEQEAAQREVAEETGIECRIDVLIRRVQYPVFKRGNWRDKQVAYFLARAEYAIPTPRTDEGIAVADWLLPEEALKRISYAQVREVVRRALRLVEKKKQTP